MKLTKRLIPAFAMLLVSAVLMSTASFAWFSMNDNVTVSNISVTAKSDTVFIQISGDAGNTWDVKYDTAVEAKLYPAALKSTVTADATTLAAVENWYYDYSASSDVSTGSGTEKVITNFDEYVKVLNYKVRNNSDSAAANLHISALTVAQDIGLEMYFVCGDKVIHVTDATTAGETLVLADTLAARASVDVTVYVYINGADENVKSDNYVQGKLDGGLGFTFKAVDPNA